MKIRAQGATEYLLILAVVLVIVAIAVSYLTSTTPSAMITGMAVKSGDNVIFTPSDSMIPPEISAGDWEWAIYRDAVVTASSANTTDDLKRGIPVALQAPDALNGDKLKIKYNGIWYNTATVT